MRRWRGTIDVPPTERSLWDAFQLGGELPLDIIYHDKLQRCRRTAECMVADKLIETEGPRPWHMGPKFEGRDITEESLNRCRGLVIDSWRQPFEGKSFHDWHIGWRMWMLIMGFEEKPTQRVGIVTHNRNIQALYATHNDVFYPHLYDTEGPDFLTVHVYQAGHIAPWNRKAVPNGIYLIRHAATGWGT